ncbi:Fc receptor-like protein 3 [Strix aluco]|uniref:Fc receptor-like protein 3 n=1 Tax=Strix aluco TaxID=111821 RepID=UPI003DA2CECB
MKRSYTYRFNLTRPKDGGSHACAYTVINRYRQPVRSLQSKSIIISVKDHPPQPTLTLTPSGGVAVEGQVLVFLCAAPAGDGERRFNFYKDKVKVMDGVELTLNNTEAQLQVVAGGQNHTGNFSCGYKEETEGRWIPSYLSQPIDVLVKERASPPQLSVDPPSGVVSEDYPLRLTCAASRDDFELKFRFYRNGVQIPPGQTGAKMRNDGNFSQLFFPKSPRNFGGKFSCGVEEEVGGTWVPSPPSETVDVTVKELPSQPALLLDPPSGQVLDGDPLVLTCAATGPVAQRNFSFYKDGNQQFSMVAIKERVRFSIPVAKETITTGHFTCRYEEKVNDRWIPSPFSQAMTVITQARSQLLPLMVGGVAGGVMLLLGLLLAVCLCRRRRGGAHWKGFKNKDDPSTYPMAYVDGGDP